MPARIDPAELRTLSDLLAVALDGPGGGAVAALDAVRRRARQDSVTGGALKNLCVMVHAISQHHLEAASDGSGHAAEQTRAGLREAQRRLVETRLQLDRERHESDRLAAKIKQLERHGPDGSPSAATSHMARLRMRIVQLEAELSARERRDGHPSNVDASTQHPPIATPPARHRRGWPAIPHLPLPPMRRAVAVIAMCLLGLLATDQGRWDIGPSSIIPRAAASPPSVTKCSSVPVAPELPQPGEASKRPGLSL